MSTVNLFWQIVSGLSENQTGYLSIINQPRHLKKNQVDVFSCGTYVIKLCKFLLNRFEFNYIFGTAVQDIMHRIFIKLSEHVSSSHFQEHVTLAQLSLLSSGNFFGVLMYVQSRFRADNLSVCISVWEHFPAHISIYLSIYSPVHLLEASILMYKVMQLDWRCGIHLDRPLLTLMAPDVCIRSTARTLMDFLFGGQGSRYYHSKMALLRYATNTTNGLHMENQSVHFCGSLCVCVELRVYFCFFPSFFLLSFLRYLFLFIIP